jgi:hypothetical protein
MAKGKGPLTAKSRNRLAHSSFALPGRRYPIDTIHRGRNALARVSQHGTPSEQARVHAAVCRKYPSISSCN